MKIVILAQIFSQENVTVMNFLLFTLGFFLNLLMNFENSTVTITLCDQGENEVGVCTSLSWVYTHDKLGFKKSR